MSYVVDIYHQKFDPVTKTSKPFYTQYRINDAMKVRKTTPSTFCSQEQWSAGRERIFQTLRFDKSEDDADKSLCYDGKNKKLGISFNLLFLEHHDAIEDNVKYSEAKRKKWKLQMLPYDAAELKRNKQRAGDLDYLRDFFLLVTNVDKDSDKLIGFILGADEYGYTNKKQKYYLDVFCSKEKSGKYLMTVYKQHFKERPTILMSNISAMYFYDQHGFKIANTCAENFTFPIDSLQKSMLNEGEERTAAQKQLGQMCIQNRLGHYDNIENDLKESCYKLCNKYQGAKNSQQRNQIYAEYDRLNCFENVAMIYCPKATTPGKKTRRYRKTVTQLCVAPL